MDALHMVDLPNLVNDIHETKTIHMNKWLVIMG